MTRFRTPAGLVRGLQQLTEDVARGPRVADHDREKHQRDLVLGLRVVTDRRVPRRREDFDEAIGVGEPFRGPRRVDEVTQPGNEVELGLCDLQLGGAAS
jgi:hypothetical protein